MWYFCQVEFLGAFIEVEYKMVPFFPTDYTLGCVQGSAGICWNHLSVITILSRERRDLSFRTKVPDVPVLKESTGWNMQN